jgi:hypothetical protein
MTGPPREPAPMRFRVVFYDHRSHRDYVGRRLLPKGRTKTPPPKPEIREFKTLESATAFRGLLMRTIPPGELAVTIHAIEPRPRAPQQMSLVEIGRWPLQYSEQKG